MIGDWDQSFETAQKLFQIDPDNIIALKSIMFYYLLREGNIEMFSEKMEETLSLIEKVEPRNFNIMLNMAILFSRVSGRNPKVLSYTMKLIQKCRVLNPLSADNPIELAEE